MKAIGDYKVKEIAELCKNNKKCCAINPCPLWNDYNQCCKLLLFEIPREWPIDEKIKI